MARVSKATKSTKPATTGRKPGRPAVVAQKKTPAKAAKAAAAAPKRASNAAPAAPKLSKDELRALTEKLERANATLRAKNRDANKAAKVATARIAELEEQVAQLEKKAASQVAPAKRAPKPEPKARSKRQSRAVDPGDAVPPGVAVQEPGPLDEEAETAREDLEEHLGGE
jgi:hypothetical protein